MLRLKEKLRGATRGELLSIEGQVTHLISEATDPAKLARMFPGYAMCY